MSSPDVQQPIIPEARDFVAEVNKRIDQNPKYELTQYGHAAGTLAFVLHVNSFNENPEEAIKMQRQAMISKVQRLLDQFGPDIITYLKDELKLVIEEEQLTTTQKT